MDSNQLTLSDESLLTLCEYTSVIACQCPAHLVALLRSVRRFRNYTADCITQFPGDADVHMWLRDEVMQVEAKLIQTVFELLQKENLLDEHQQIDLEALGRRNRLAALEQSQTSF